MKGWSILLLVIVSASSAGDEEVSGDAQGWPAWAGHVGGGHFSPLTQITRDNADELEIAWVHRSGDFRQGPDFTQPDAQFSEDVLPASSFQVTPIVVEGALYYCTPFNRVFALNPETGEQIWVFDPEVDMREELVTNCRGVSSWIDARAEETDICRHRIIVPTLDARIIAVDGRTGRKCPFFGRDGEIDLSEGVGKHQPREYSITSPPVISDDKIITGAFVLDAQRLDIPSGVVRAFDVRNGRLVWAWNPVAPGEDMADENGRFVQGTTNVWSVMSADEALNLVYVPTGNSSPDYFGGLRDNRFDYFSSSIVALDASTGEVVWHQPTVHHDVWDYDVPAQPTLVDLEIEGKHVPALVQVTKMGLSWVLDRRDGTPVFEIEERPVPQSGSVEGEYLSPTQPFPVLPEPLHPLEFSPADAWGFTSWDKGKCRALIEEFDHGSIYTPISERGTVLYPSPMGGNNWGALAVDPDRKIMIVNTVKIPYTARLVRRKNCKIGPAGYFPQLGTPFCVYLKPLVSPLGAPCSKPPWATLDRVNLETGKIEWQVPLGTFEGSVPLVGRWIKGSPGIGGPLITRSGLIFVAAGYDRYLRVFDTGDGREMAEYELPTLAASIPMSYQSSNTGTQFIVIAVGGHWTGGFESGDYLIAYALRNRFVQ